MYVCMYVYVYVYVYVLTTLSKGNKRCNPESLAITIIRVPDLINRDVVFTPTTPYMEALIKIKSTTRKKRHRLWCTRSNTKMHKCTYEKRMKRKYDFIFPIFLIFLYLGFYISDFRKCLRSVLGRRRLFPPSFFTTFYELYLRKLFMTRCCNNATLCRSACTYAYSDRFNESLPVWLKPNLHL